MRALLETSVCTGVRVVRGLDNFEVGLSNVAPAAGSPVNTSESYTLCGKYRGSVTAGMEITVKCAESSQTYRYVIVRSSDAADEHLCVAEVAVYPAGEYVRIGGIGLEQ